jgi:hypothetical protein
MFGANVVGMSAQLRRSGAAIHPALRALAVCVLCVGVSSHAFGKDDDDDSSSKPTTPTTYIDLRTSYATIPGGALGIGFGSASLVSVQGMIALATANTAPAVPTSVKLPTVQAIALDIPLTVDVTDRVSIWGGVSASANSLPVGGWTTVDITSWNIGFQADLYQQNGGKFPTVTLQSTITQAIPNGPFVTTSFQNILEFDYAFDADETRGLLAGVQDTRLDVGNGGVPARINPDTIGYVGGYYQWPNNWKLIARAGVQYFGGLQLLNRTPIGPFTEPIVRFDLDRMDDNDNRLFGVMVQIQWIPKPSYLMTFRTPLYLVRN